MNPFAPLPSSPVAAASWKLHHPGRLPERGWCAPNLSPLAKVARREDPLVPRFVPDAVARRCIRGGSCSLTHADELRAVTGVRKSLVFRAPAFVFQCPSCHGGLGVFLYFVAGSWCDALS